MSLSCYNYRRDLSIYSSGRVTARCHGLNMVCQLDRDDLQWYAEIDLPTHWVKDTHVVASGIDLNVYQISFDRSFGSLLTTVCVSHRDNYSVDDGPNSNKPYHTVGELITTTCALIKAFSEDACCQQFDTICQNQPLRQTPRPEIPSYIVGMDMQFMIDLFSKAIRQIHQSRSQTPCQRSVTTQPLTTPAMTQPRSQSVSQTVSNVISQLLTQAIPQAQAVPQAVPETVPEAVPESVSQTVTNVISQLLTQAIPQASNPSSGQSSVPQTAAGESSQQAPDCGQSLDLVMSSIVDQIRQMSMGGDVPRRAYECPPTETCQPSTVPPLMEQGSQTDPNQGSVIITENPDNECNPVQYGDVTISDIPIDE